MKHVHFGDLTRAYANPPETLGQGVVDDNGDVWRMAKARTTDLIYGASVRHAAALVTGTITTAAAIGSRRLIDSAAFAALTAADLIGAVGRTQSSLANGGGQNFVVTNRIDDNELQIQLTSYNVSPGVSLPAPIGGGWAVATNTSTTFTISMRGQVQAGLEGFRFAGNVLVPGGVDVSETPYFFVKTSGIGDCVVDGSDNAILDGEPVSLSASTAGYIQGPNATTAPLAVEVYSRVGVSLGGDIDANSDTSIPVLLETAPWGLGRRVSRRTHPMNEVDIPGV